MIRDEVSVAKDIDLHGYHPRSIQGGPIVEDLVRQSWEMGLSELTLIHGHGMNRGSPRPFANTNTGYLGLTVRHILRYDRSLRQWMYAKFDVSDRGATTIRLRPNPAPSRTEFDALPESDF
jgi:DNA-nicking Smr family endonuclease